MSSESIKSVSNGTASGRRVMVGGFLTAAVLVVPAVVSCGGAALASTAGAPAGATSGVTGARPTTTAVRVDSPAAGMPYSLPTPPPAPGAREPGSREPGSREPGSREPGSREPGSREPGTRQPGGRQPGAKPRTPGGRGAESASMPDNGRNGGREAGRGGGRDGGRSGLDSMKDVDALDDVEATDGRSGKLVKKPAAGWGRSG